ncbi:MAG: hypothetical protein IJD28_04540 [Deferribacterales bacterium]|nr:hypothetical protein [Deferribacterales bacterium]
MVITGDHFDRIHPNPVRSLKVKNGVPLILYGKNVADAVIKYAAGSHIDIMPTIVELTAPKGFTYHSFGLPLLSLNENTVTDVDRIALGYDCVASGRFIASDDGAIQYFDKNDKQNSHIDLINHALFRKNMGKALSYYILEKGI